jgi:hypothetical protein
MALETALLDALLQKPDESGSVSLDAIIGYITAMRIIPERVVVLTESERMIVIPPCTD